MCRSIIFAFLFTSISSFVLAEECALPGLGTGIFGTKTVDRGHFSSSMEHSSFTPCNSPHEEWWVVAPKHFDLLTNELEKLGASPHDSVPTRRLFAHVALCLSKPGAYGHMGRYGRYAEFLEIMDHRPPAEDDCSMEEEN